jgi:TolB protein
MLRPLRRRNFVTPPDELRPTTHRLVDALIGALTGTNGGFASHMTFVSGTGLSKRVYKIDADDCRTSALTRKDHPP